MQSSRELEKIKRRQRYNPKNEDVEEIIQRQKRHKPKRGNETDEEEDD